MPGCIVSATTASFRSVEKRRRRATPVITSTFENVSDVGVCLGLSLGPPASAGVRSKRGALHLLDDSTSLRRPSRPPDEWPKWAASEALRRASQWVRCADTGRSLYHDRTRVVRSTADLDDRAS